MKPKGMIVIDSDGHRSYPPYMKDVFKKDYVHNIFVSGDDITKTELFPVNNMCGCLRDDIAMLLRRTRNACKDKDMLTARLKIYTFTSNYFKKKEYCHTWKDALGKRHKSIISVETPAMKMGIFNSPVGYQFLLNHFN